MPCVGAAKWDDVPNEGGHPCIMKYLSAKSVE